jgi:hypothetical protein
MSEAELHVLRARLNGGIRNKAARGELQRNLPVGFVWGEADGETLLDPDEAVRTAIEGDGKRWGDVIVAVDLGSRPKTGHTIGIKQSPGRLFVGRIFHARKLDRFYPPKIAKSP